MNLTLAFSPCPNDTFIFDALVNKRIDTLGFDFRVAMEDVETLNRKALQNEYDVTKLSFAAYAQVADEYELLNSGSALGKGCGPLLITHPKNKALKIEDAYVAVPGFHTTANLLFSMFYPGAINKIEKVFSEIEEAVLNGEVQFGVLIHENRFTYETKGLIKVADLGELWEQKTGRPIPLGGIAVRRSLPADAKAAVNNMIKESVQYAFAHPDASKAFVKANSQEMDDEVIRKHIELYVNEYTIDLGKHGRAAVDALLSVASNLKIQTTTL